MLRVLLLIYLTLSSLGLNAANDYIVNHYTMEQGLMSNNVYCSLRGKDGFLWVGTWYGLCRFDGYQFQAYHKKVSSVSDQIPRKIEMMAEDGQGNIWIKTLDWKLSVFCKKEMRYKSVYNEIKRYSHNIQIIKIQPTSHGGVLLLTKDKNLLLGHTDAEGKVYIQQLVDAHKYLNTSNYRLRQNILSTAHHHISWVGMDFQIASVEMNRYQTSSSVRCQQQKSANKLQLKWTPNEIPTAVAECGKNALLVGTNKGHVWLLNAAGACIPYSVAQGKITHIILVSRHQAYINIDGQGMYVLDMQTRQLRALPVHASEMTAGFIDRHHRLWTYQSAGILSCYDGRNVNSYHLLEAGTNNQRVPQFCDTGSHGLFFLSPAGELVGIMNGKLETVNLSDTDGGQQQLYSMHTDSQQLLWLASGNDGVYRICFPSRQFRQVDFPFNKKEKSGVRALFQLTNGDVWMGTRSKDLYVLDRNAHIKKVYTYAQYHFGSVYYMMYGRDGHIWMSTKGNGLIEAIPDHVSADGYHFVHYIHDATNPQSISGNNVYTTFIDSHNHFWVGTLDGGLNLMVKQGGKTIFMNKQNGFSHYPLYGLYTEVRNISESRDGRIWVGTIDGLMSFDSHFSQIKDIRFETYGRPGTGTLINSDIYALFRDHAHNIWLSGFGVGICKLTGYDAAAHKPTMDIQGMKEGVQDEAIVSIIEDKMQNIWLASDHGLSCYLPKADRVRVYDEYDGMPDVHIEETSALLNSNGEIWIGCRTGLLIFNPAKMKKQTANYPTYIVGCTVNNQDVNVGDANQSPLLNRSITYANQLTLKHDQSMFTLEFAALNYVNQSHLTYRYRLEGYDHEWHYSGTNRQASYTNVPSGDYIFRVETLDASHPELNSSCTLQVKILPPWWATWWAYIIYGLMLLSMAYAALRFSAYLIRMRNNAYISDKLAELKIRFFTNISHELRTPLTLIQGSIKEIKDNEHLSSKGQQYMQLLDNNSQQMANLVNSILDFRKIRNGKMRLYVSQIDLTDLLQAVKQEFDMLSKKRDIQFQIEMKESPLMVCVDAAQLSVVIRNLLSNAFKFTPAAGRITLKAQSLEAGVNLARIMVENTGSHITEGKEEKIFERFSQDTAQSLSQTTTPNSTEDTYVYHGTGIGLALSHDIVELHHGHISAVNMEEGGVRFTVDVPTDRSVYTDGEVDYYLTEKVQDDEHTASSTVTNDADDQSKPQILIVDDNADLCKMLRLQLSKDFRVALASDGIDGLEKVKHLHPDVVVSDQMMPRMDGFELLKSIRSDFNISHIPVIMLTALSDDSYKTKATSLGANAYIAKPFRKEYLEAVIHQQLEERRIFREHIIANEKKTADQTEYAQHLDAADHQFVNNVHKAIDENLQNPDFNVDAIAANLSLSRSTFFKKLKSLTGLSPVDFIKEYRLNKAMKMILTGERSINQVAFSTGFTDSSYFGKCFRKKFGKSPREYITELKEQTKL